MKDLGEGVWGKSKMKGEEVMYEVLLCARLFAEHWESRREESGPCPHGTEIWKLVIMTQDNQCCEGGHPRGNPGEASWRRGSGILALWSNLS